MSLYPKGSQLQNHLHVRSDLKGVWSDYPGVLKKIKSDRIPFSYDAYLNDPKMMPMTVSYGDLFYANLVLNTSHKGGGINNGVFAIGQMPHNLPLENNTIFVKVNLPTINVVNWQHFYKAYMAAANVPPGGSGLVGTGEAKEVFDVTSAKWIIDKHPVDQMRVIANTIENGWQLVIHQKNINGTARWLIKKGQAKLSGQFKKLLLPAKGKQKKPSPWPDLSTWPAVDLSCASCGLGQYKFTNMHLVAYPEDKGYNLAELSLLPPNAKIKMHGFINSNDKKVALVGQMQSNNVGGWMKSWQIGHFMSRAKGKADFVLTWDDTVLEPKLKDMDAELNVSLTDGRLDDIGSGAQSKLGLGRLLNLFSVESLPKRLTLNFSDLSKKGFQFNHLNSHLDLVHGVLQVSKTDLNGPVADITIDGMINFLSKKCNLNVNISPYVTSSAPFIATIAGGPVVGAVTWVANKILSPGIGKAFSLQYRVTGTLDKPIVVALKNTLPKAKVLPKPV